MCMCVMSTDNEGQGIDKGSGERDTVFYQLRREGIKKGEGLLTRRG